MRARGLHVALGAVGIAAWMLFILGCVGWSAWSPDGKRVLFSYKSDNEAGVAVYEVQSHSARPLVLMPAEEKHWLFAQWEQSGKRAIIYWFTGGKDGSIVNENGILNVQLVPMASENVPLRQFAVPYEDVIMTGPYPELNGKLYISGKSFVAVLDLNTGVIQRTDLKFEDAPLLATAGNDLLYITKTEKSETHPDGSKETHTDLHLGVLGRDFSPKQLFEITQATLAAAGVRNAELDAFPAVNGAGTQFAFIGVSDEDPKQEKEFIVICTRAGMQRILQPDLPKGSRLANLVWSPDERTLYASALLPTADEKTDQYALAEIRMSDGAARTTPIARISSSAPAAKNFEFGMLQVSLSPDGGNIATSTAYVDRDDIAAEDRGFFLINLRDPGRKVTKIPVPAVTTASTTKK